MRVITFKVDPRLLEVLDAYAKSRRMSRSEVIREAIVELLRRAGYDVDRDYVYASGPRPSRGELIVVDA